MTSLPMNMLPRYLLLLPFIMLFNLSGTPSLATVSMVLEEKGTVQAEVKQRADGIIEILTQGDDPQVVFRPASGAGILEGRIVLAFEYFSPDGVDGLEVFYNKDLAEEWSPDRVVQGGWMPKAETWQPFAVDMAAGSRGEWSTAHSAVRLDFGRHPGVFLQLRNVHFRVPTAEEQVSALEQQKVRDAKLVVAREIDRYLARGAGEAQIEQVAVGPETVTIRGKTRGSSGRILLIGLEPHENEWETSGGAVEVVITGGEEYVVTLPRQVAGRDRIVYRWALAEEKEGRRQWLTHAQWPTRLDGIARYEMPRLRPANRKGLAGITLKEPIFDRDLTDLGITAATVNLDLSALFSAGAEKISYRHQEREWHFSAPQVKQWDQIIRELTRREIVTSAILLVSPEIETLVHPEYRRGGIYSMANLTNAEGADAFRAAVSFLAERYSRPNRENGWITHWIVFNEIDHAWVWTNMGEQPMSIYMDTYHRALRLTWLEVAQFNPTVEVFISLTHHWDWEPTDPLRVYPSRGLIDRLGAYTGKAGDFPWGTAFHPYPQSIFEPRTWQDSAVSDRFDTPYITMKNIEVLDAYLRQEPFLRHGKPRTILFSEQGYHTPDYSEASLLHQAAAIAYTWEKLGSLEAVETFHYHRWVDHPMEGGLKLGLRTLPTSAHPFGERKEPTFSLFEALETNRETEAIQALKSALGTGGWEN